MATREQTNNTDTRGNSPFTHSSEAEFASLLDYYGIPWRYEPDTFVLREDEQGHVLEAFTPDFYLPDQDLYVELTTMRQDLITKKNRKIRELQQRYPYINIKLFNRHDFQALFTRWGMSAQARALAARKAAVE